MGLFDRLLNQDSQDSDNTIKPRKPAKEKPSEYFLDADSSSSLGNVDYMREAKTIRRTFPGTVDSPGTKEQIMTVAAETESLDKRSEGLGDARKVDESINLTAGVPKPVKKTFAEQVSTAEMNERLRGIAITGVNTPASANAAPVARKEILKEEEPKASTAQASASNKPGSIDPFRQMVRDLNK
tara:strand:- start:3205 stop:3756 length:552 start_codon:yes stop_codon:yes gene_type:complete